jgi:1-acyl-sn-glycerol-3-phosphate acyltransferase
VILVVTLIALLLAILFYAWLPRWQGAEWGGPWLNRFDGLNRLFCRYYHHLVAEPLPLPPSGPAIVVANHISGLDPILMLAASPRPLRFIIASEQYHRFGLQWLFRAVGTIPVDRSRRPERAFRAALKALQQGEVVALFPHGTIQRDSDPQRPLKPGAIRLAQMANCPIVPLRIDGVRAEGQIMLPVFLPARATIRARPAISCHAHHTTDECLMNLAQALAADTVQENRYIS